MSQHIYEPMPLDPGFCKCGLAENDPEHLPKPAPKPPADKAFMPRKRIFDFIYRWGTGTYAEMTIDDHRGNAVVYRRAMIQVLTAEQAEQEMLDMLFRHARKGTCRFCNADIWWMRGEGKPVPYSKSGVVHFADCSAREGRNRG